MVFPVPGREADVVACRAESEGFHALHRRPRNGAAPLQGVPGY